MKILIATHNQGKFKEIREILLTLPVELLSLVDLGLRENYLETGEHFETNALGKAAFYHALSGLPTVADDSGIFVEALGNELGVKTRRFGAGELVSDEEWLQFFMQRMAGEKNRKARFVCVAAYVNGDSAHTFYGETAGSIAETITAPLQAGIPLSSVFIPIGKTQVYSELSTPKKNALSHRGKAFGALLQFLNSLYV